VNAGTIYCGNAKMVMARFPEESVELIYMDPPFFSNRNYELVWGNGYELKAYEDRWMGGVENYIAWMDPILRECHRVLKPTGSLYLHCDWHANAHLRILLDEVFGARNFLNEIIWWYHDPAGTVRDRFKKKHDSIFLYSKKFKEQTFNLDDVRQPYSDGTLMQNEKGHKSFGRITKTHPLGKVREDVWEVPFLNSQAKERLGYPTQKPEALLDIIVKASSKPTDIVLDPMSGGGTTIAVAQRLGRRWIGIDVSPLACDMMKRRLRKLGATPKMVGMPMSVKSMKGLEPFVFQERILEMLYGHPNPKRVGDMGIDGWLLDGRPVQVKQSERVGRNVVDNFETAMRRMKRTDGIIVAFSFTKGSYEEVARAKNKEGLDIELKSVKSILEDIGAHDEELEALEWEDQA